MSIFIYCNPPNALRSKKAMLRKRDIPAMNVNCQSIQEKEVFLMDKKQTITTERKIGKITYLVQALPSEKATDTIHKKIEKLIVKDLQKKPGNPGFLASE